MSLRILDAGRLARVPMTGIRGHWTGGGHKANAKDLQHYNVLTEGDGAIQYGVDIALNRTNPATGRLFDGYAAHTLNNNTNNIGQTMCGMLGAREAPWHPGTQPLTLVQWNRFVMATADLAEVFKIPVTRKTILFHAEVQPTLGIAQRGKWDVVRLPFDESVRGAHAIGDKWRDEVLSALRGNGPSEPLPVREPLPAGFEGGTAITMARPHLNFRRGPGVIHERIGDGLPPGVTLTVFEAQSDWLKVRTPNGHDGWVHGGYVQMIDTAPAEGAGSVPDPIHTQFAAVRSFLDQVEANLPADRDTLSRMLRNMASDLETYS
ncbi:SH3 domain-containing protein [Chelativorans sp. ZYF759]|uniref:SH3 domain-containing protein n=1 Tax=Chelativorans sp. ZYF759 TaxID=2692213 RepID=UPI00145C71EB|nr:SH3 domain-containing protein [Chelativorans sp. ZYF759]NMG39873.1 SH3 domain-containing protein [Chelativorans sp. ZYF759]